MAFDFGSAMQSTEVIDKLFNLNKSMKVLTAAIFGFSKKADKSFLNIRGRKQAANTINDGKVDAKVAQKNLETEQQIVDKLAEIVETLDKAKILQNADNMSAKLIVFSKDQLEAANQTLAFLELLSEWTKTKYKQSSIAVERLSEILVNFAKNIAEHKQQFTDMAESLRGLARLGDIFTSMGKSLVWLAIGISVFGISMNYFVNYVGPKGAIITVVALLAIGAALRALAWLSGSDEKQSLIKSLGLDLLYLAGAVAGLALASLIFQFVGWKGFVMMSLSVIMLGLAIRVSSLATGDDSGEGLGKSILYLALGVAVLGLSAMLFEQVGWVGLGKVALAILGLGLAVAIANRASGGDISKTILFLVLSVALFAAVIVLWHKLIPDITLAFAPAIALGALTLALSILGKRGNDVLKASFGILAVSISMIVLAFAIKMFQDIDYGTMLKHGLALTGITVALLVLGNAGPQVLFGAGALLLSAISLIIIGKAMQNMDDVDTQTFINVGLFVGGIGLALTVMGLASPAAIIGASALLIGSFAIKVLADAMQNAGNVESMTPAVATSIGKLGVAFALLGNPFTLIPLLAGVAAANGIAFAVSTLSKGFATLKKHGVTSNDAEEAAAMIGTFMTTMGETFSNISGRTMFKIWTGVGAVGRLGNVITTLAKGVADMANLTVTEYTIRNDEITPKSVRKLTKNDFDLAGQSIKSILEAVTEPLAEIGAKTSGSFLFKKNPVSDGIKAVSGLGSLMVNLAKGVADMADLTFVEYKISGDKIVPASIRKLGPDDFHQVGVNLDKILTATSKPLATIGADTKLFTNSDVKRGIDQVSDLGNLIVNLAQGVKDMASLTFTKYKVVNGKLVPDEIVEIGKDEFTQVGINLDKVLSAVRIPLEEIGAGKKWLRSTDLKKGIDQIKDLNQVIDPVVALINAFNDFATGEANPDDAGKIVGTVLKNVSESLVETSNLSYDLTAMIRITAGMRLVNDEMDKFEKLPDIFDKLAVSVEKLNKQLTNDKFEKIVKVAQTIESMAQGKLNQNFKILLEQVSGKMSSAVQNIEKAISASNSLSRQQVEVIQTVTNAGASGTSTTSTATSTMSTDELYTVLIDILSELRGTLNVSINDSTY